MMKLNKVLVLFAIVSSVIANCVAQTTYSKTCPNVENIIRDTIREAYNRNKTVPAALLRLHFHDCFVDGCDASVLLDSTPIDKKEEVEKKATGNIDSVRGYELVDEIKSKLEAACPGVVSCADIVAMAARDAIVFMNGRYYTVPTGRFDGRRSNRTLANSKLPSPFSTITQLKEKFAEQGLSTQDLVLLSGAHTIGRSRCTFFETRVFNFSGTGRPDPAMNKEYVPMLRAVCKGLGTTPSPTNPLDKDSEFSFDNTFYKNLVLGNALLKSDQELIDSSETAPLVRQLANDNNKFFEMFTQSMINMGNIQWKKKTNGEIRKKCNAVNTRSLITTPAGEVASF